MATMAELLKKNAAARQAASPLTGSVATGPDVVISAQDTVPVQKELVKPNMAQIKEGAKVYRILRNLPMITRPVGAALRPVDGFYYVNGKDDQALADYFVDKGMLEVVDVTGEK